MFCISRFPTIYSRFFRGLLFFSGVLFIFTTISEASQLDSLENWAKTTFWGHYIPPDSLVMDCYIAIASGDFPLMIRLSAGISYLKYDTIDSAMCDIAYGFIRLGDFSAADDAIDRAKSIWGENTQVVYLRALEELYSGNPRKAQKILKRKLKNASAENGEKFLLTALGMMEILDEKIDKGFKHFQNAENLAPIGFNSPMFEISLFEQTAHYNAVVGTLKIWQYYGLPSVIIRLRPIFRMADGSLYEGGVLGIEQVASLLGSPYFQVNVHRSSQVVIPRWDGISTSADMSIWVVYIDSRGELDSSLVKVNGELQGFLPADSFTVAIEDLREDGIKMWFDSLAKPTKKVGESFGRLVLSERVASALSDSEQWEYGKALVDSFIEVAPYITELYLWRGAFSLFEKNYGEAYDYFSKPLEKDSCNIYALYDAGVASYFLGNYEKSESLFVSATECQPNFAPPYLALGVINQDIFYNYEKAMRYYKKYLKLSNYLKIQVEKWMDEMKQ